MYNTNFPENIQIFLISKTQYISSYWIQESLCQTDRSQLWWGKPSLLKVNTASGQPACC